MPPVCRLTDIGSGHGSWPPTDVIESSSDTIVNGLGAARIGDALRDHGSPSPSPPHPRHIATGSSDTICNGLRLARIGDSIDCGGLLVTGSPDVICNGN